MISPGNLESKDIYVTEIPPEFRRVELFVSGTVPNKVLLPTAEENPITGSEAEPNPTGTPFTTWTEAQQDQKGSQTNSNTNTLKPEIKETEHKITIMICPITGMRAVTNCPQKESQTFKEGEQPKEFCTFHVNAPK